MTRLRAYAHARPFDSIWWLAAVGYVLAAVIRLTVCIALWLVH